MNITIEKGIPIPGPVFVRDLEEMELDDSFTFPESRHSAMRGAIVELKTIHPKRKYKTRVEPLLFDMRRIWRVK